MSKKINLSKLVLFTALSTLSLASCNKGEDPVSSVINPTSASTSSSNPVSFDDLWKSEDEAHTSFEYKGAYSTGDQGVDYSSISASDKASILGDIEAYGLKNHLLGIPLFGNGGWTLVSTRISSPVNKTYIPNYGFGFEREGRITSALNSDQEKEVEFREFFHHGLSDFPSEGLNPFDSNNSSSSNLLSYITGSLYGNRLVKDSNGGYKNTWEWYPSLAESEPEAIDLDSETNTATTWRVKVRKDDEMKFHTNSTKTISSTPLSNFNGKKITAQSFVDAYRIMCNGNNKNSYASQYTNRFVGTEDYAKETENVKVFSADDDTAWAKTGIKLIDENTIEFQFKSPQTKSNAMMNISLAPTDRDFFKLVTGYDTSSYDPLSYGKNTKLNDIYYDPSDTLLQSGPYVISNYSAGSTGTDNYIAMTRVDDFIDRKLENNTVYNIKGHYFAINSAYGGEGGQETVFQAFKAGKLDTASIPASRKNEFTSSSPEVYVEGNTTIQSLQVNSTTEERWNEVYGKDGLNWQLQTDYTYDEAAVRDYEVKPVMSNADFLDGLYFSLNRVELAESLMANPSSKWLAEAYLMDVDSNVSYTSTYAHHRAVKEYSPETYGYSTAIAQSKFKKAMQDLTEAGKYTAGTASNPTEITISILIMRESQRTNWASKVAKYMEDQFNAACNSLGYKLTVEIPTAPARPSDVYATMARGAYDLASAGISGGTGDAFGMSGVYIDSWDYGLQMGVGVDTNLDTGIGGITYKGYSMSMRAAFAMVEYGEPVVIENGVFKGTVRELNGSN